MNTKLLLRTVFLIAVLLLLVMMGMNNRQMVELYMPPLLGKQKMPAAIMYFAFFGVGVLSGTLLTAGGKGGSKSKGEK